MKNSTVSLVTIVSLLALLEGFARAAPVSDDSFAQWVAGLGPNDIPDVKNSPSCNGLDGFYPIEPGQCASEYYGCYHGDLYYLNCPEIGQVFDPATSLCTPYNVSSCATSPTTTTRKPFDCAGAPDGNYPIGSTCGSHYFICLEEVMYPMTCPGGGVFDPVRRECVSPSQASCTTTSVPTTTVPTTTTPTTTVPTTIVPTTTVPTTTVPTTTVPTTTVPTTTEPTTTVPTTTVPTTTITTAPPATGTTLTPCTAVGVFQIPDYCGPDYYACVSVGAAPERMSCPNPPYNYFDSATSSCKDCYLAACASSNPSQCYPTTTSTTTPAPTLPTLPFTLPFTFTTPRFTIPRFTTPTFPTLPFTLPFTLSTQASTMSTTSSVFSCTTGGVFQIPGYCGPDYYSCSAAGVTPERLTCPNAPFNYFDYATKSCVGCALAACVGTDTSQCPVEPPPTPPPTTSPVVCPSGSGGKFYQIKGYCGPSYYYCSTAGRAPILQECTNPSLNYFDCRNGGYCTSTSLANCKQAAPVVCTNEL